MEISHTVKDDLLIIAMKGEMDHHNLLDIKQRVDPLIITHRPKVLVMDLTAVPFCDSSGIAAVIGRFKLCRSLGGQLVLHGLSPQVRKVLALGGVFNIVREVEAK